MKKLLVKRVYDDAATSDGYRILVDRMWPRGVKKEDAHVDDWLKELTPEKSLISWFHDNKEKHFDGFEKKYDTYLSHHKETAQEVVNNHATLTLVTAVKDINHSHIPTLKKFLHNQNKD